MRKYYTIISFLVLSIFLISWGGKGHRTISSDTAKFLNEEMTQFSHWPAILSEHASDADSRKYRDPTERPKHYIDIDNYPEFDSTGRIPQTLDSVYMNHTAGFVDDNGYLPWATKTAYDSVKSCFLRRDWNKAVLFAADLGHYVADAHMPLHITRNYDGQFTGNTGIHSRYESKMIDVFASEIIFEGDSISVIDDVMSYIFEYIYSNYKYVDSVILADDYAFEIEENNTSSAYTARLWENTRSFTIPLFRNASHALTELIYTAWDETGRPSMNTAGTGQYAAKTNSGLRLYQNYPNPFNGSTRIRYSLTEESDVKLYVINSVGMVLDVIFEGSSAAGDSELEWYPRDLPAGNYFLILENKNAVVQTKMMMLE